MGSPGGACWAQVLPLLVLALLQSCRATCYFPMELQGEFVMQSTEAASVSAAHPVQYSQVNIEAEAIPIWGQCHRRLGNHVILMDDSGVEDCIRCFLLRLRARNVLQVHTEGLAKCYTTEEAARATCPNSSTSREILLYKTRDLNGDAVLLEPCPLSGHFRFTYNINDGSETNVECPTGSASQMHTCPSADSMHLQFRGCSFDNHELGFQCLGEWAGPGAQQYLALKDTRRSDQGISPTPRYRCALYHVEPGTGNVMMTFSSDSTCLSNLHTSAVGYEMLTFSRLPAAPWPEAVEAGCHFPAWMQGKWQHLQVAGNTIQYADHETFNTYSIKCVGTPLDRFLVFTRTQCGDEAYTCIWIKKRSFNILEFQLGKRSSPFYSSTLCNDENFQVGTWITQGRLDKKQESPCPIPGEYTGEIPDVKGLCAKLWSNCNMSETMYYTVADCSSTQVYEERQYRCLGQWEEGGRVYTYTQRLDVSTGYECFVGQIMSDTRIYIKEAGQHCQRVVDPLDNGMELTRQGPCYSAPQTQSPAVPLAPLKPPLPPPVAVSVAPVTRRPVPLPPQATPTRPWKPITGRPQTVNSAGFHYSPLAAVLATLPGLLASLLASLLAT